jgi:hypothetical protein
MKFQIGQRWLWHFSFGGLHNDVVLEVTGVKSGEITFRYIHVIESNDDYDKVGRIRKTRDFGSLVKDDLYEENCGHTYTYLRGQDKPTC